MNKCIFVGRLTKDPELRYTQDDKHMAIVRFSLAVDRRYKKDGEQGADFPSCIAFGKTAEFIGRYFKQGDRIGMECRVQTGSYTNKEGKKVYTTDFLAENVEFAQSKSEGGNAADQAPDNAPQTDADGFMQIPEGEQEELPWS